MFLWKTLFFIFIKAYRYSEHFSNSHVVEFFEINSLEEVSFLTILIPKSQNKVVYYTCSVSLTNLFLLRFLTVPHFSLIIFFTKTQNLYENMFFTIMSQNRSFIIPRFMFSQTKVQT